MIGMRFGSDCLRDDVVPGEHSTACAMVIASGCGGAASARSTRWRLPDRSSASTFRREATIRVGAAPDAVLTACCSHSRQGSSIVSPSRRFTRWASARCVWRPLTTTSGVGVSSRRARYRPAAPVATAPLLEVLVRDRIREQPGAMAAPTASWRERLGEALFSAGSIGANSSCRCGKRAAEDGLDAARERVDRKRAKDDGEDAAGAQPGR